MENRQATTDSDIGIESLALQETIAVGEGDQQEIFHDSLTEAQWQEQLKAPATNTDQERDERERRLKERWQLQNQTAKLASASKAEGNRQHPPNQITKNQNSLRLSKTQMVGSGLRHAENYRT